MFRNLFTFSMSSVKSLARTQPGQMLLASLVALGLAVTNASGSVQFTSLYSFSGYADGCFPWGNLMQGSDGNLYGMANYGGAWYWISGNGTVFQMTLDGSFTPLYAFESNGDGSHPNESSLVEDSEGWFYGTTTVGGSYSDGAVFIFSPEGFLFPIYSFSPYGGDGVGPSAGVMPGADGGLYGTTENGGANNFGTIFRVTANWDYRRLFSFDGTNGASPYSTLVQGRCGDLYGTTFNGGTNFQGLNSSGVPTGSGTVFKITTNGVLTSLFSFSGSNGAHPFAGLVEGEDGSFYGTTELGGANNYGTVFKITTNGTFTSLYSFTGGVNGAYPTGKLVRGSDGNFYGTTADTAFMVGNTVPSVGSGTIFRVTPAGTLTTLYTFRGTANGVQPIAGLLQASDGNLYGVTSGGGTYNLGTIFRLNVPMAPRIQKVQKTAAKVSLTWTAVAGQTYQVQYSSNPGTSNWNNLGSSITATNGTMTVSDSAVSDPQRFYRVVLPQ